MTLDTMSYKSSGVDIDEANAFVESIKPLIKKTARKGVLGNIGNYAGLFRIDNEKYKNPVLVSATDGVGTKLRVAHLMDIHDTVGIDLVAMNVNDVIVLGAEPLFFLDYIAIGKIDAGRCRSIVDGIAQGCTEAGCALIGGETAEMPGFYKDSEYDLAGFCVGVVEHDHIVDGSEIKVGDRIIGLASSGLHSNGFSLVRKVLFEKSRLSVDSHIDGIEGPLGIELLRPTRIYVKPLLNLIKSFNIKGIAHITGGGFIDNIPRIMPERCKAVLSPGSWNVPPIFTIIAEMGGIDDAEMYRVFNMGLGMIVIVSQSDADDVMERARGMGEKAYLVGSIEERTENGKAVVFG
jgi:phosphoribosylformylglycinamidine cyclo-ligase